MESFPQWQQNKLYIDHIRRLRDINHRSTSNKIKKTSRKKFYSTKNITNHENSQDQNQHVQKKLSRYDTQPVIKRNQIRAPIPLVSYRQGKIITSAFNERNISLKQKQTLLQNYLLSKRILQTKSVINKKQLKKQFRIHKKASQNLSKSKNSHILSQQRALSNNHPNIDYKMYEKQKQQMDKMKIGQGRNHFYFKIKEILLIKGIVVKNSLVLYNIKVFVGKHHYQFKALEYDNLFDQYIRINFKRSILISNPQITIYLSMLRQNHEQQIGNFKPIIRSFENKTNQVYKIMKGKFPVGTIDIEGRVTYFINKNKTEIEQDQ